MKNCGTCYFEGCLKGTEDPAAYDYPPPCADMRPPVFGPDGCLGWRPKDVLCGYLAVMQIRTNTEGWRWARLRLLALNASNARFQAKVILKEMGLEFHAIGAFKAITPKDVMEVCEMYNPAYVMGPSGVMGVGPATFIDLN